ncbi:MAG: orotidine-5'-phosphate decarboxylase [Clostridia bacterium]|nr:orotidine-5'-phosphate decarboxylase [Clostridia bacterium]
MSTDILIKKIIEKKNPTVAGLDPLCDYLPQSMITGDSPEKKAEAILKFNMELIDALYDIVPAVKPQAAYYELLGAAGYKAFCETVNYAKSKGLYVIADGKRNDIGSTATAYSKGFFDCIGTDALTVNAYLGFDGVEPFIVENKAIYILVKTSNKGSGQLQDLLLQNGKTVYEHMGDLVSEWGEKTIGEYGYSNVGAVVGATYPEQLAALRERLPHTFFLVPGYGAQGGGAKDVAGAFKNGLGAVVNSSRGIMCAYKKQGLPAEEFAKAARAEAIRMRDEIMSEL